MDLPKPKPITGQGEDAPKAKSQQGRSGQRREPANCSKTARSAACQKTPARPLKMKTHVCGGKGVLCVDFSPIATAKSAVGSGLLCFRGPVIFCLNIQMEQLYTGVAAAGAAAARVGRHKEVQRCLVVQKERTAAITAVLRASKEANHLALLYQILDLASSPSSASRRFSSQVPKSLVFPPLSAISISMK